MILPKKANLAMVNTCQGQIIAWNFDIGWQVWQLEIERKWIEWFMMNDSWSLEGNKYQGKQSIFICSLSLSLSQEARLARLARSPAQLSQ
jgi:hypothetical protein